MKKYIIIGLVFIFIILLFINNDNSYAYISCDNKVIEPYEVNTNNLKEYLNNSNYNYVKSFCFYEMCYEIREDNIDKSINNFIKLNNKRLSADNRLY